jgi:hypothetical protein
MLLDAAAWTVFGACVLGAVQLVLRTRRRRRLERRLLAEQGARRVSAQ